ncbi:MAG: hypothetical protein F4229_10925 [Gammaproteobacteria bacterium]|nr:hypothetical protein [Gammaproteobacteria bacterium]MYH16710.1 hypothetical protein [Gammaproteobacteria bacterium]MYK81440.1 hypothetical protein [Gammaproteobacteria bacterium]
MKCTNERLRLANSAKGLCAAALLLALAIGGSVQAQVYEVGEGHLSVSVRQLVESHGWSLIWATEEDRNIDVPFTITNRSLQDALIELLTLYKGKLVADLYASNRVVVIDLAPPDTRVLMPGEQSAMVGSDADGGEALPPVDALPNDG